jgi:hypothetical protein
MDTTNRTANTFTTAALSLAVCLTLLAPGTPPQAAGTPIVIHGGDTAQVQTVKWALGRYRVAGLQGMPTLDVYLHTPREACKGYLGTFQVGRIDLCTGDSSEPYARKFALHELAHAWATANVDSGLRERFMKLGNLAAWNDFSLPWKERGTEQAAEIIAWGLGEGEITPLLPLPIDPKDLIEAYALLTGRAPLAGV